MFRRASLSAPLVLAALAACSDGPTPPITEARTPLPAVVAAQIADVRAVDIDLPPEPRPWDTSVAALESAIAAQGGHAVIGFKAPASGRAMTTGRREAVPETAIQAALELLEQRGATVLEYYWLIGGAHVQLPPGAASVLREDPLIDYIEPRQQWSVQGMRAPLTASARIPVLRQTGQTTPWGVSLVRAPEAWTVATGAGATVQIIDSGHKRGHEDLPLVPLAHCAGPEGGCDDGPISWHGTHVMGTLVGRDNAVGVVGVAPGVAADSVYVYGACYSDGPNVGDCDTDAVIGGIQASVWFDVLSMSLGGNFDFGGANAIAQAWADDVVLVAAAGNRWSNESPPASYYPAGYTNVIGVSGVRDDATFANGSPCPNPNNPTASAASNYGSYVDIAGPFWALSTVGPFDDTYAAEPSWCGTSMATPHVSGAAALLRQQNPTWTNQQIRDRLLSTASPDCGGTFCGAGILDAGNALGIAPPPPLVVSISGPSLIKTAGGYNWTCNASGGAGGYSYEWSRSDDGGPFFVVGFSSSYSRWVDASMPSFELLCEVTSGIRTASEIKLVAVAIPSP